jgi:hypothetical protein
MLANRIPQGIRLAKTSQNFKQMKQGNALKCRVRSGLGLKVDRNHRLGWCVGMIGTAMVYCLSNNSNNFEFDECSHRGLGGIIQIPWPVSISNYNKYMGGVDLADMRRLHCNSTIMGQNQLWLKLFSICSMLDLQKHFV